jgi:hypothetical protein
MRRYVFALSAITVVMLAAVAIFNRIIDPFGLYDDVSINGLNRFKTEIAEFERHVQPQVIRRLQPNALVLGSSIEKIGLDPARAAFSELGRRRVYNFAFFGGGWHRTLCYFEYAADTVPLERAVIGIFPEEALPAANCASEVPEIAGFSAPRLLLSKAALAASNDTIRRQRAARSSHSPEGRADWSNREAAVRAGAFRKTLARMAETRYSTAHCQYGRAPPAQLPAPDHELDLGGLKRMLELAQHRNVELKLYIRPHPAQVLELDVACNRLAERWGHVGAIAELVAHYPSAQLWGFDRYNDFTFESVVDGRQQYWPDALHFFPSYGNSMLDLMFGAVDAANSEIGMLLTPASLPQAYRAYIDSRSRYLQRNPWMSDEVRALAHDFRLTVP